MSSVALPILNERFNEIDTYRCRAGSTYTLLPFRFLDLDSDRYILTNFSGEYLVIPSDQLLPLVRGKLQMHTPLYNELKSLHFLCDGDSTVALDLLSTKYRTRQELLSHFTSLFMFVVTLRCEHSCPYCQVSRQCDDRLAFDMPVEVAERAIDFMFRSPSPTIKVEFQGGEPLLNFDLVRHIVGLVEQRNQVEQRNIAFVIATNLALLTDEVLDFCIAHDVYISTSLDGPRELHNRNRPRPGGDSFERAVSGIRRVREALGPDRISALMTTTLASLSQPVEIIDEYLRQGFCSIFLRSISPYGFAIKTGHADKYHMEDWLGFYRRGLEHIIDLNRRGVPFREEYSSLILKKMLTLRPTGYVDLQSPAGMGISCLAFNYDGAVYASDEARMLAEMGDYTFRLGDITSDSFEAIMTSDALLQPLATSMSECVPMCADCGVQPYCGSDPLYHHATQGDPVGFKPSSGFCMKNMTVIRHLITLLEDDAESSHILKSWAK
jgi:uncharacterized protein